MSGGKGGAPKAPDYEKLAQQQAQAQLDLLNQQTLANRVNQYTPWGSVTWNNNREFDQAGYDAALAAYRNQANSSGNSANGYWETVGQGGDEGQWQVWRPSDYGGGGNRSQQQMGAPNPEDFYSGGDRWSQTVTLSPEQQALFDQYNRLQQGLFGPQNDALSRVQQTYANGFDQNAIYDPQRATNNATELLMERINPQLDQQYSQLQAQLANQGIAAGSEAFNNALTQFQQGRNDAYNQASLAGIGLGMQQQDRLFNQAAYLRQLPLQELQALMGGTQVGMPQMPGYSQAGMGQAPDMVGAAGANYNAALDAYNASQAQQSGIFGGLGSLAGVGLGHLAGGTFANGGLGFGAQLGAGIGGLFSDRRLKTNIKLIGRSDNGLNIYSFQYKIGGPTQIGHMAQEVQEKFPDAVSERDGYLVVDYARIY